jgi:hypothetical protein
MANNHVIIPPGEPLANKVIALVSEARDAHDHAEEILGIMNEIGLDTAGSDLAAALGIASGTDALNVRALILGAYTYALNLADFLYMINRLG